jgi:signal transduction histidine kinase
MTERAADEQLVLDLRDRAPYLLGLVTRGVLHDLATLTGSVLGSVQLAQLSLTAGMQDEAARWLRRAEDATRQIDELRRGLLTFAAGEQPHAEPIDVSAFVLQLAPLLQRLVGANIRVETDCAPILPPALAVSGHLSRVLFNLVVNARDAIGRELDDHGSVVITTALEDGAIVFSVADSGCGMPPETLARLFTPYFTTKGAQQGTGLGLVACRQLLEQGGGAISVESAAGRGTTVRVTLPSA